MHGRVDHLVNNAGLLVENRARTMTLDEWDSAIRVNLSAAFYLAQAVLGPMIERGFGRIVNVSSVTALMGSPVEAGYGAAKAGLFGLSRSLAREVARKGITVNTVVPGVFETDMTNSMAPDGAGRHPQADPARAPRRSRRAGPRRALPARRTSGLRHGLGRHGRRRPVNGRLIDMSDVLVLQELDQGVLTLTLNRPERNNGWTLELEEAYFDALAAAAADAEVRAIVVTGAGRAFCPGLDVQALSASTEGIRVGVRPRRPMTFALSIPKPVIAAINGACAGIGFIQAACADLRFGARGAKLTTAFARRGLPAENSLSWLLPRLIGHANAADLLLSAAHDPGRRGRRARLPPPRDRAARAAPGRAGLRPRPGRQRVCRSRWRRSRPSCGATGHAHRRSRASLPLPASQSCPTTIPTSRRAYAASWRSAHPPSPACPSTIEVEREIAR